MDIFNNFMYRAIVMLQRVYSNELKIEHYLGKWHEIASFPTFFEQGCTDVTATYALKDNYIEVFNSCKKGSKTISVIGRATITNIPNLLKVQFYWKNTIPYTFKADYLIEFVSYAEQEKGGKKMKYQYAIVGNNQKSFLWILARSIPISKPILKQLVDFAKFKGYDVEKLVFQQ